MSEAEQSSQTDATPASSTTFASGLPSGRQRIVQDTRAGLKWMKKPQTFSMSWKTMALWLNLAAAAAA